MHASCRSLYAIPCTPIFVLILQMSVLILVASEEKKKVGSTVGMQESVKTSPLIKERIEVRKKNASFNAPYL